MKQTLTDSEKVFFSISIILYILEEQMLKNQAFFQEYEAQTPTFNFNPILKTQDLERYRAHEKPNSAIMKKF
jgi:hypothetical protein